MWLHKYQVNNPVGFISFLFSWPGHAACTPSSGSTDSLGTGPPGNSLQWVSTNVYTFASTMTTKITKYLCHLRKFLTFSPGNPHFAKAPKILNTDHVRLVLSLLINEVVHYIHLWAWLLSVNNRWDLSAWVLTWLTDHRVWGWERKEQGQGVGRHIRTVWK